MVRARPSLARRKRAAVPRTRVVDAPTKRTLRTRFHRVKPIVKKWRGTGHRAAPTTKPNAVLVKGYISGDYLEREVKEGKRLPPEKLERWGHIHAGQLPPGDPTPPAPTPEEVDEREQDALAEVQRKGDRRNERVRDEVDTAVHALNVEIRRLESVTGKQRPAALRRANRLADRAQNEIESGRRKLEKIADDVREERARERNRIRREADIAEKRVADRIEELHHGLKMEIEQQVNKTYFDAPIFDIEDFEFFD